jgi:hypothetical protein
MQDAISAVCVGDSISEAVQETLHSQAVEPKPAKCGPYKKAGKNF